MKKKIILFALCVGVCFTACSDFLAKNPYNQIGEDVAITNYNNARYAISGVYDRIKGSGFYGRNILAIPDAATENAILSPAATQRFNTIAPWTATDETSETGSVFSNGYSAINALNRILAAVDKIEANEFQIREIKAQCLALRAICHFEIARLFCQAYPGGENTLGIPYISVSDTYGKPERGTLSNTYSKVIADLKDAIPLFSNRPSYIVTDFPTVFFLDEWAAKAMLARVYMMQLDYSNAKPLLQDIIINSGYALLSNANFLAAWAGRYNATSKTEFMFALSITDNNNNGTGSIGYTYLQGGYNDLRAAENAIELFSDSDIRKSFFAVGTGVAAGYMLNHKFITRSGQGMGVSDVPIVRLSDIFLLYAEACAYTGDDATAITYLDRIRLRADPNDGPSIETGEALKEKIFLERRKELMYEGHYLHDLKRMHKPITSATRADHVPYTTVPYPSNLRAYPIPRQELSANPNMVQNPY